MTALSRLCSWLAVHGALWTWNVASAAKLSLTRDIPPQVSCPPPLPYYMGGRPERQVHEYGEGFQTAPHTADGGGLSSASTGEYASFTIRLAADNGDDSNASKWNNDPNLFFYVWIAGEVQFFTAEVVNNQDGTLSATYIGDFPGDFLVYVEEINLASANNGKHVRPITGSPFELTITGPPLLDPDTLPLCGAESSSSRMSSFWRTGSWLSSHVASGKHGVLRNGWVFQPEECVYDTFSYDDLMVIAALNEPTWLLVIGGSVQRGAMLSLLDMALSQGQKDSFSRSAVQKCWGWSDVRIGNLRITYQDMRLWTMGSSEDVILCNDEKLASGSTAAYLHSAEKFLREVAFADDSHWPDAILAPSFTSEKGWNLAVEVPLDALPPEWGGKLLFIEHMAALGTHWHYTNPTMNTLDALRPSYRKWFSADTLTKILEEFEGRHPSVEFMSVIPIVKAILWENERMGRGQGLCYGCSQHYHYVTGLQDPKSFSGSMMVHSLVTETLANILIGKALGSKEALYERAAAISDLGSRVASIRASPFEVCTDCPASLVPFHVKSEPVPQCKNSTTLPIDEDEHEVWDNELCPDWCMKTVPVSQTPTQSGMVNVRECRPKDGTP